jgi:thiosulfate/3-mercaptopyruvate sulfurtransferase
MRRRPFLLSIPILPAVVCAAASDPWPASDLISPKDLAGRLNQGSTIIYVGFPSLYRGAHIPGAVMQGPASKPEALDKLKQFAAGLPKDRKVVLYCGCCPFAQCPNVRPAYSALQGMGFKSLKVLAIEHNFHTDWVSKGYPTEKGG